MNTTLAPSDDMCILVTVGEMKADGRWQQFKEAVNQDKSINFEQWSDSLTLRINPKLARVIGYVPVQDEIALR